MSEFLLFLMYTTGGICEYEQQKFAEQERHLENVNSVQVITLQLLTSFPSLHSVCPMVLKGNRTVICNEG